MTIKDEKYMRLALKFAALGGRAVAPNPMVGAVIVKNGKVIGQGYHQRFGGPHAEVNAIRSVENPADLKGATLYVTLEPCRHHGKTPPCQELIDSVGIDRIVCGSRDPFQKSRRPKNLKFVTGPIAKKCEELNKFFFTWIVKKRPFITVKIAISADGFVAGFNGQSVRFTSKKQDTVVHQLRAQHQAILVGSPTVLLDNPLLNVRHAKGPDPLRIVLDSKKRVPKTANVFRDGNFLHITKKISLKTLFQKLAKQGIASVLVEPGPTLYQSLKNAGLIDQLVVLKGRKKIHHGLPIAL